MNHRTSPDFWKAFYSLPADIQSLARNNYELLKNDPRHPSLHFKKVAGYWSVRVGRGYRALGTDVADGVLWFWIGTHGRYDQLT